MSTRSQKRRNINQESSENVSGSLISPIVVENEAPIDQDVFVAGRFYAESSTVENSRLECLRASLKEEITSEIKSLLAES